MSAAPTLSPTSPDAQAGPNPPACPCVEEGRASTDPVFSKSVPEIWIEAPTIKTRIEELGKILAARYRKESPYLVSILNGAFVFTADLVRAMDCHAEVGFMAVSSYGNSTRSSGTVRITKDLQKDIWGRDVLIVEDIVDTGLTLKYLREMLLTREPRSLSTCALLSKTVCRKVTVPVEYVGFEIPDKFVVGYGLDYRQHYRNLPYIGVLDVEESNREIDSVLPS